MTPDPEPANPGGADNELPSEEEFLKWLKADPKHFEYWSGVVESAAQNEALAPELRSVAQHAVAKRREAQNLKAAHAKFLALVEVMNRPAGSMLAADRLAQCNACMDELTDALLETPEPHRTAYLKQVLPLREKLRAMKVD